MISFTSWALLPIAMLPGIVAWHWGRRLHRHIGDPLFAERFWLHGRRVTTVSVAGGVLGGYLLARQNVGVLVFAAYLAVLMLGLAFANYDTRKRIFGDTWSFATYALFRARFVIVFVGFWLAVGAAPFVVVNSGRAAPVVGVLLMAVLLAWHLSSSRTIAQLLGAEPLEDESVQASLSRLLAKTALARPHLFRAGPPGGMFANAFAFPSLRGSGVLFFRTLLERLSPLEIEAILAHELAHLEQFNEAVLRRHRWTIVPLIVVGTGVLPFVLQRNNSIWIAVAWLATLLTAMASIGRGAKQRETSGDQRAAELVGDPEALITALTRLYAIGHLPRRWDASTEARATHPALARRIRALRATAGSPEPVAPIVIRARAAGEVLIFDTDRVRYLRDVTGGSDDVAALLHGAGRAEAFLYDDISSVHIAPTAGGADVVIESGAKTLARVAVTSDAVPAAQSALDRFDVKFGGAVASAPFAPYGLAARFVAIVIGVIGFFVAPAVVLAQAVVTLLASSPRAAAALAAAITTLLLYLVAARPADWSGNALVAMLVLLAWFFAIRWRREIKEDGPRARLEIAALAVWAVASLVPFVIVGGAALRIGQVAAGPPAAIAAALSVAAWLWFSAERRSRATEIAVLALVVAGGALAMVGTTWFLDSFSRDRLLATGKGVNGQRFEEATVDLTAVSPPIDVPSGDLRLSPNARAFGIVEPCEDEDTDVCARRRVTVGDMAAVRRTFEATDVQFADDERVVILTRTDGGATLRTENLTGRAGGWTVTLDGDELDTVIVSPASGEWAATSRNADEWVLFRGRVGDTQTTRAALETSVVIAEDDYRYVDWKVVAGPQPVGIATRFVFYNATSISEVWRAVLPSALRFAEDTAVVVPGTPGPRVLAESALDLRCFDAAPGVSAVLCVAGDGRRTHVWRVNAVTGSLEVVGWFDGTPWAHAPSGDRVVLSSGRCTWRVLDVSAKTIATLRFPAGTCPESVSLAGSQLAVMVSTSAGSALQLFALH